MIRVYILPGAWGLSTISAFCLKLETYLQLTKTPYERVMGDLRKAPKGKAPWIEDDGKTIADSEAIIEHLEKTRGISLDAGLSATQQATAHALTRMLEEHTYFGLLYFRWQSDEGWAHMREALLPALPSVVGGMIAGSIRKSVVRTLYAQGLGRHTPEEIVQRLDRDLEAVEAHLSHGPFFFGEKPDKLDATLFGILTQMLTSPWSGLERTVAMRHERLVNYQQAFAKYLAAS